MSLRDEDAAAIARIRQERDPRVRDSLIGAFVKSKEPLIRVLAEKYARIEKTSADLDDIHEAGRIGLFKSFATWDHTKGSLATWAGWQIRRAVQDLAHAEQPIKLPQIRGTTAEREAVARAIRENPDVTAAELGVPEGMIERVKHTTALKFVSVDMFGESDDDAPRRARRIERRMAELDDGHEDAESELDDRRLAEGFISSLHGFMAALALAAEDAMAFIARALDLPPPYAEGAMAPPKAPPAATHSRQPDRVSPWNRSRPKSSTTPPLRPTPPPSRRPLQASRPATARRPLESVSRRSPGRRPPLTPARPSSPPRRSLRPSPPPNHRSALDSTACSGSPKRSPSSPPKIAPIFARCSASRKAA